MNKKLKIGDFVYWRESLHDSDDVKRTYHGVITDIYPDPDRNRYIATVAQVNAHKEVMKNSPLRDILFGRLTLVTQLPLKQPEQPKVGDYVRWIDYEEEWEDIYGVIIDTFIDGSKGKWMAIIQPVDTETEILYSEIPSSHPLDELIILESPSPLLVSKKHRTTRHRQLKPREEMPAFHIEYKLPLDL